MFAVITYPSVALLRFQLNPLCRDDGRYLPYQGLDGHEKDLVKVLVSIYMLLILRFNLSKGCNKQIRVDNVVPLCPSILQ